MCPTAESTHTERNHQGLENRLPQPESVTALPHHPVQRRQRLGGMLSYYHRAAACRKSIFLDNSGRHLSRTPARLRPRRSGERGVRAPQARALARQLGNLPLSTRPMVRNIDCERRPQTSLFRQSDS